MLTEAHVAALRGMLFDYGLIKTHTERLSDRGILLSEGEWLVSLLSHSQSLCQRALDRENLFKVPEDLRILRRGWTVEEFDETLKEDIVEFVDTIRFLWLNYGLKNCLDFIDQFSFSRWLLWKKADRGQHLDSLVTIGDKKMRRSGLKYREYATFFLP